MRKFYHQIACLFLVTNLFAQTAEQIKQDNQTYLFGEGSGRTLEKADQYALSLLISQISTQVESKFSTNTDWGTGKQFNETVSLVMSTYSSATLHSAERLVISNEPDAKVLRYIRKADMVKVFNQRKIKISEFVKAAIQAEANVQIADALRYYSWALTLLKSHPDANEIYNEQNGQKNYLLTWIPVQMNNIFAKLSIQQGKLEDNMLPLEISYSGKPVSNFDYSYWDGKDWSNIISAKDGKGFVEFTSTPDLGQALKLKAEYIFKGEARIDKELDEVMKCVEPVPFRNSYFNITGTSKNTSATVVNTSLSGQTTGVSATNNTQKFTALATTEINAAPYTTLISKITAAIRNKNYASVQSIFTPTGFEMFQKLVAFGNARIIDEPGIRAIRSNNMVMCRSVLMSFAFKNNTRKFIEDVVFMVNDQMLVESVTFGLGKPALADITGKQQWNENDRMLLVNFLEHYKTAYALKRLDYIESIFADNALIIVGSMVKANTGVENQFKNNKIVRYNRLTKEQYIKNLKYSFASNEFINLKFEDNIIRKSGQGGNVYGIQIKQNYFSDNYGDVGYLFLMVDLTDPKMPVIHVRTWQPEKNADGSIYGIEDF